MKKNIEKTLISEEEAAEYIERSIGIISSMENVHDVCKIGTGGNKPTYFSFSLKDKNPENELSMKSRVTVRYDDNCIKAAIDAEFKVLGGEASLSFKRSEEIGLDKSTGDLQGIIEVLNDLVESGTLAVYRSAKRFGLKVLDIANR